MSETIICPGRIDSKGEKFRDIFLAVLFHEATHDYLDAVLNINIYNKITFEIIEESLCEAVSLSRFLSKKQRFNVIEFMSNPLRPPEYTGYSYWIEVFRLSSIKKIVDQIKTGNVSLILSLIFYKNTYGYSYLHYVNKLSLLDAHDLSILYDKIALDILRQ